MKNLSFGGWLGGRKGTKSGFRDCLAQSNKKSNDDAQRELSVPERVVGNHWAKCYL